MLDIGDDGSLLEIIEKNPLNYPRLIRSKSNSQDQRLKISLTGFKEYLGKTFYFETMVNNY